MDLANLIIPILLSYWYIVPLLMLVALVKSPWFKGVMGEWQINLLLKYSLPRIDYCLIKNVTIPTEDGTTQIDHIVVSRFGIFVIETKNSRGWIFGSEHQKRWTQKIFKTSHTFQNPLHQNYKHVKTWEALLVLPPKVISPNTSNLSIHLLSGYTAII